MKSRAFTIAALSVALLAGGILAWIFRPAGTESPARSAPPVPLAAKGQDFRQITPTVEGRTLLPEIRDLALGLQDPQGTAQTDIDTLQSLFEEYRRVNGRNPNGLNFEIVHALQGANRKNYAVLPPDLGKISPQGDLLDRWGTPYFFHNLSPEILEIQSAGADRKFGSEDDIGEITQL